MWQVKKVARPRRMRAWLVAAALVPAIVLGLSACSSNPAPPQPQVITDKGTPYGDLLVPKLTASVKDGAVGVSVESPVTVSAEDGVLGAVTMVNDDGTPVAGQLSPDGLTWSTTEPLGYNKRYTLNAQSLGLGGVASQQMTFETHSPENLTMPYVLPNDGEVVGVGQPVAVRFDENIPNRLAAQKAIKITTNPPVEGAFYWLNNREVRWRPAAILEAGHDRRRRGQHLRRRPRRRTVRPGERHHALHHRRRGHRDRRRQHQDVTVRAQRRSRSRPCRSRWARTAPRPTTAPTSSATGSATSSWTRRPTACRSTRRTATAPRWTGPRRSPTAASSCTPRRGRWAARATRNVSHGCLNVSPSNAQWFYDNTKRGDIVEVVNTVGSTLPGTDGLGDWNIPWEQWKAGNANI